jgi:nucleoside phosphorylase
MFAMDLKVLPGESSREPSATLRGTDCRQGSKLQALSSSSLTPPAACLPIYRSVSVVATSAIRDEELPAIPAWAEVACKSPVVPFLERELIATGWTVRSGKVWTTDAPYRETKAQLTKWTREGVLAVEMQAASLFAFGAARHASVASVAMVSNAVDHAGAQFDTWSSQDDGLRVLKGIARAARSHFATA